MEYAPVKTDPILAEFMAMSDNEHLDVMCGLKGEIGERLLRWGKGVYSWKLKGKSMDALGLNGMTHWLLMVGGDELYAPLLARTMRDKKRTDKLSNLSYTEQKFVGDGGKVEFLLEGGDIMMVSPVEVQDQEVLDQIIGKEGGKSYFRSLGEQKQLMEMRKRKAAQPSPERIGNLAPDQQLEGCTFLGKRGDFISADTLLAAYRACRKKPYFE